MRRVWCSTWTTTSHLLAQSTSPARLTQRCHIRSGGSRASRAHQQQHQQQHSQSRQAGRAAARASPLSHNLHTPDAASSSSPPPGAFGSTTHERRYDPSARPPVEPIKDVPRSATAAAAVPVVAPYSALAYRSRLRQGHVHSLLDLAHAPYAPRPLQVLMDVFAALQLHATDADEGTSSSSMGRGLPPLSPEATRRLQTALSCTPDVALLLNEVVEEVAEVVKAAEALSDRESQVELQELATEVEQFITALMALPASSSRPWQLPDAVYVEALHEALRMVRPLASYKTALVVLEALLAQDQERREAARADSRHHRLTDDAGEKRVHSRVDDDEVDEVDVEDAEDADSFSLDAVVTLVEAELAERVRPVTADDHLLAMESCAGAGEFTVALMLYKRLVQHAQARYVAVTAADFERALIALAHSVRNAVQFAELQTLLIESDVAQSVPVTVELYAGLIDAVSRAEENPERMSIALALYRRLRDGQLTPNVQAYSALMACCASCKEPTHAFAFYHEARLLCGASALTPAIYTNLLLSYANAGFGADARSTLEVLVEAGAPLTRAAFHAVLAGAVTVREAQEVLEVMTGTYHIPPTPHTFAFLVQAAAKQPRGVGTALQVFDFHEEALRAMAEMMPAHDHANPAAPSSSASMDEAAVALSTSTDSARLERCLLERYPHYVQAMEHALMKLRIDPHLDPRLAGYLKPLVRLAQQHMNRFTGNMPPQAPTFVPPGAGTCIAVLAPDVLADLDTLVEPFMSYYTAVVIPYSALVALSIGGARRRVEGASVKGVGAGLHDGVWQAAGNERNALIEHRRRRLCRFLEKYREAIHIVSLDEELTWSRDASRYGIAVKDWPARSAALAIQLARRDEKRGFRLYAEAGSTIVLVSTDYSRCGRYVVDLKQQYARSSKNKHKSSRDAETFAGLRDGLSRVLFHNPRTQPQWAPPSLSASQFRQSEEGATPERGTSSSGGEGGEGGLEQDAHGVPRGSPYVEAVSEDAAAELYKRLIRVGDETTETKAPEKAASAASDASDSDMLDAELLLDLMNA